MNSSYIITQSNHQKSNIANIFGRTADAVIPNVFPARDATTFKSGVARVVWIGNLKPLKRPELFIKLASSLRKSGALFTMIGRDPNTEWSSQIKHSVAEVPNLEFLGELSIQHVNEILSESHILVNTSKYEGFPNTFIQAWMNRMPVVSIDIDPDDILTREGIGFVSRCFRDLTSNVRYLLDHEDVVKAMGEKAHEYALTNHDESNFDKLLEIFRSSSSYSGPIAHIFS
jgi:glycosyltransferase involved in cell wall biosynthesis